MTDPTQCTPYEQPAPKETPTPEKYNPEELRQWAEDLKSRGYNNETIAKMIKVDEFFVAALLRGATPEVSIYIHQQFLNVLDANPGFESRNLRDYLTLFLSPGEIIWQEITIVGTEVDPECIDEDESEVTSEENGFLMKTQVPRDEHEDGGMWVELHSVASSTRVDNHDKFKRMMGKRIRVTVEILGNE